MSRAVLISIRPKWCEKIANGKKTIEVRKTRPKLETPFKCYIYCTKNAKMQFWTGPRYSYVDDHSHNAFDRCGNGKVIGRFVCDKIYEVAPRWNEYIVLGEEKGTTNEIARQSCLDLRDMHEYLQSQVGYGWHISDLKIYNQPKELNEFWFPPELYCEKERCGSCPYDQVADVNGEYGYDCEWKRPLKRPPQSWQYVEELK